jgi:hypothetical protein
VLPYLDLFERLSPGEPWTNYYRADVLLALKRPTEALAAADEEAKRNPACPFTVAVHRAAAVAALENFEELRARVSEILDMRLSRIDYLTLSGLSSLAATLWNASAPVLAGDDPLRRRLEDWNLASGLAPNEVFTAARENGEPCEGVNFYECVLRQPLDDCWKDSIGCLCGQDEWQDYLITYGVLARNEDEAAQLTLAWQSRAYPLPPEVVEIRPGDAGYRDRVGVVWQGYREPSS